MAAYEDSYKSQLQGVSQQIPRDRLDGQVTAQDNMLSDTVTNLRRRPGARHLFHFEVPDSGSGASIRMFEAQIKDRNVIVLVNAQSGEVRVVDENYEPVWSEQSDYLRTVDVQTLRFTALNGELVMLNTAVRPTPGDPYVGAVGDSQQGFFYVKAGAFSKTYTLVVTTSMGTGTYSYTTPDSTATGAAASSTPEFIALSLANAINAGTGVTGATSQAVGNAVAVQCSAINLTVSTPSGASYIVASNRMVLNAEADLPSKLPDSADTFTVRVGDRAAARYYRWNKALAAWLESASIGSPTTLVDMPLRLTYDGATFSLVTAPYEGRLAGDETTNPDPEFVRTGITGMSTYQGRLVLFAGSMVYMSASSMSTRFYRSTVVSLLDNDPIGIGSSGAASAVWRYGVPYQKDLILFSADEQGLIPGANTAITPRTAVVLPSTKYTMDVSASPVVAGRTLMYSMPRSSEYFGVLEMSPSTVTDGQYVSDDATPHLPKYMPGRCRFIVSSSVANMAVFGHTGDRRSVTVHEYFWSEGQKVQQAWHRWTFPYDVADVFFKGNSIVIVFVQNGMLVACAIDPRQAGYTQTSQRRPFLDLYTFTTVVDRVLTIPTWMLVFDRNIYKSLVVARVDGPMAGERVGFVDGATHASFRNGDVAVGLSFRSSVSPTPPIRKDERGVKVSSNKLTVTRFAIGTNKSSQYKVRLSDKNSLSPQDGMYSTLYFSSPELVLGAAMEGGDSTAIVPARMLAETLVLELWTEGTGELNLVGLEFVAKYHERIKRA